MPGLEVRPVPQIAQAEASLLPRIRGLIFFMVALILVLTTLCVFASMAALAMERRRDVGLMKAIGGSISRIVRIFFTEAAALGLAGALIGYVAGIFLSRWIGQRAFHVAISVRPEVLPIVVALMVGVSLAGALPLRLLGRVRPAEILRGRIMPALVEVKKLGKRFGDVQALEDVSFEVAAGEWIAIMGPSGSGKTTLMNILGGLDRPTSGNAIVDGLDVSQLAEHELTRYRADKIGFVFQQYHLVPYLTAVENVMLAQYFHSITNEDQAIAALARVGTGRPSETFAFATFRRGTTTRGDCARAD